MAKSIRLYWWSEIFIQKKDHENYGDLLGKYLVERISGKSVIWLRANRFYIKNFWQPLYVTIGSILDHIGSHCTVWGSGISNRDAQISNATFIAVRGPLSRKRLLELGYECPEIYGDPALLLPDFYNPSITKEFELGIVPHINDYELAKLIFRDNDSISIIDFRTNDIELTTNEILKCKRILSSSLHGIIVAHTYQIPALQIKLSENIFGDGVKYEDYLMSVGLLPYEPVFVDSDQQIKQLEESLETHKSVLPDSEIISKLKLQLKKNCPFKSNLT